MPNRISGITGYMCSFKNFILCGISARSDGFPEKIFDYLSKNEMDQFRRSWNGVEASITTSFAKFLQEQLEGDQYTGLRSHLATDRIKKGQIVEVLTGLEDEVLSGLVTATAEKANFIFMLVNLVQIQKRISAANLIVSGQRRFEALFKVCKQLRNIGELETAKKMIDNAIIAADQIADREEKSAVLSQIASELREMGEIQWAEKLFEKGLRVAFCGPFECD